MFSNIVSVAYVLTPLGGIFFKLNQKIGQFNPIIQSDFQKREINNKAIVYKDNAFIAVGKDGLDIY
jgi:hypothetical protein